MSAIQHFHSIYRLNVLLKAFVWAIPLSWRWIYISVKITRPTFRTWSVCPHTPVTIWGIGCWSSYSNIPIRIVVVRSHIHPICCCSWTIAINIGKTSKKTTCVRTHDWRMDAISRRINLINSNTSGTIFTINCKHRWKKGFRIYTYPTVFFKYYLCPWSRSQQEREREREREIEMALNCTMVLLRF